MPAAPPPAQILEADLTWTGDAFESGVGVEVDGAGRIAALHRGQDPSLRPKTTRRLPGRALLPGLVNAHSHAFQRGLRGRGETFPAGSGSFWTWRQAMYSLVGRLDRQSFQDLCTRAFREMRAAGITTVGEFHYFHHETPDGAGPDDAADYAFDEVVLAAARQAGIRLVLLEAYYRTGGVGKPLEGAQKRFGSPSPEAFWRQMDHLAGLTADAGQGATLGAVVHSLRAADPGETVEIWQESRRRGLVLHMHVEEQRQEIADCLAAYGQRPLELLLDRLEPDEHFTAVHCTHSEAGDMERFAAAGANVAICPLTEANLGDGIADLPGMRQAGAHLCLGTDSNARISMLEEMRWLEYVQRLARERRGVIRAEEGDVARPLWHAATAGGARALGLDTGRMEPGAWADFLTVDLTAPALAGWDEESLLTALILGAGDGVVRETCVGGRW